jgi:hypothetical protein
MIISRRDALVVGAVGVLPQPLVMDRKEPDLDSEEPN